MHVRTQSVCKSACIWVDVVQLNAGDGGIKRLARKVDGAVRSLSTCLSAQIQPALQQAVQLLSQLQGLARSAPHLANLGLQVGMPVRLCGYFAGCHCHTQSR